MTVSGEGVLRSGLRSRWMAVIRWVRQGMSVRLPEPGRDRYRGLRRPSDPSGRLLASRYRPVLEGWSAIISFVTVAELEYGARLAGWGPDRLRRLEREIARAEIVWPGPNLRQA